MKIQGLYTALVTPFRNGAVDYDRLTKLVEMQISYGVDGISPVGTTGESPTLSFEEHERVIATVVQLVNGRCKVLAGSGANSTAEALHLTRHAKSDGADFSLQVAPYYNKPTQEGLYRHFATIADSCDIPIVIYNVPGRSGVSVSAETIARLAKNHNVAGVKEASYDLNGLTVKVAVASGTKNAKILMDKVRAGTADYTFIEIMCCPGGCINGGGQPTQPASVRNFTDLKALRAAALYENDKSRPHRKSHESEDIKQVYAEFLGEPNSHKAHELLHTTYVARPMFKK